MQDEIAAGSGAERCLPHSDNGTEGSGARRAATAGHHASRQGEFTPFRLGRDGTHRGKGEAQGDGESAGDSGGTHGDG